MNRRMITMCLACMVLVLGSPVMADTFGTGDNQFTIDFVTISGETNPTSGYGIVDHDYRIGVYETTNGQWDKFKAGLGIPVTGDPATAYDNESTWIGANIPTNNVSWYEAAQFINWLNTSSGYHAAYNFSSTQGTEVYSLELWSMEEASGGTNLYRHKDAFYYLPTEDEWVKAGYWNGSNLQTYATKAGETLYQGDGMSGTGWNYDPTNPFAPWNVGSGSQELNGTYDMMGNIWEWMENPYSDTSYGTVSYRGLRGGAYNGGPNGLTSSHRIHGDPDYEYYAIGFRVASVPEPATLSLLAIGGLVMLKRKR